MNQFWMITLQYLNQHKNSLLKTSKRLRLLEFVVVLHTTKTKVVDEALESLKKQIKKLYIKRDASFQLKESKSALKKFAIQYRINRKYWIDPDLFSDNAKQSITSLLMNRRQTKVKFILSCMM